MRVLFDDLGLRESHGGVSRYFSELFRNFPSDVEPIVCQAESVNEYMLSEPFNIPRARYSFDKFLPDCNLIGRSYFYRIVAGMLPWFFPAYELANQKLFRQHISRNDFDILHLTSPHGSTEGWGTRAWHSVIGKKPIVLTVHDLIPDKLNKSRRVTRQRKFELDAADHVVAVSNNTKQDIIDLYNVPESKISVIYHGYTARADNACSPIFPDIRYVLYVGKRGGYKNSDFFIRSMAPLLIADGGLHLVFTGGRFSDLELKVFTDLGIANRVHQRFVSDAEMSSLMANAVCFVYPSRYEGFGIPILDAFSVGCPVVLSRCSCFPEVAGDAALYFEDGDAEGLRNCVKSLSDDALRQKMIGLGKARVQMFSWHSAAMQTADIYRRVKR